MKKRISVLSVALSAIACSAVLVACSRSQPETAATPTATPTPAASASPAPSPTPATALPMAPAGSPIPPVAGQVIAAVTARQAGALEPLVQYQDVACTTAQGAGGPPKCGPGEADGTVVRRFPTGACEGEWTADAAPVLSRIVTGVGGLYGVATLTRPQPDPEPYWPKGDTVVMFRGGGNGGSGGYFILAGDRIVRAHSLCDRGAGSEESTIKALGGAAFLIAPTAP